MQDKIYTVNQMRELEIITSDYHFNTTEAGEFTATLDLKAYAKKGSLRSFYTLEDGRRIITVTQYWHNYLGVRDIKTGAKVRLTFSENPSGGIYLTAIREAE